MPGVADDARGAAIEAPLAPSTGASSHRVEVVDRIERLEELRAAWDALAWHPNADLDYFRTVLVARSEISRPYVLLLRNGDDVQSILIARIDAQEMPCRLGYRTWFSPKVRALNLVMGGWLGQRDTDTASLLIRALVDGLKRGEADLAQIGPLDHASPLFLAARRHSSIWTRHPLVGQSPHYRIDLPESIEALLGRLRSKHRYWFRRLRKQLDERFPEGVELRRFQSPDELDALCRDAEAVARKTYHRTLGVGFVNRPDQRGFLELAARKGWLRGHVLYAGGSPRAFWIARVYRGVAHLDFTGFDPELRAFEPGTLLFLELLAQLCAEGVKVVDCGLGDAQYKRRFGVHSWDDRTMLLFAATPRGLGLNLLRTATTALSDRLSARLGRSSLALRLKKRWRGQLAARTQEEA